MKIALDRSQVTAVASTQPRAFWLALLQALLNRCRATADPIESGFLPA